MTKLHKYILTAYCLSILLITIYVPCIVQESEYIGQAPQLQIDAAYEYHLIWNISQSFNTNAIALDWAKIIIEICIVTEAAIIALYVTWRTKRPRRPFRKGIGN